MRPSARHHADARRGAVAAGVYVGTRLLAGSVAPSFPVPDNSVARDRSPLPTRGARAGCVNVVGPSGSLTDVPMTVDGGERWIHTTQFATLRPVRRGNKSGERTCSVVS